MGDEERHPVIVDTDALIAVANTNLWPQITESLQLTTTNVCYHELKRHTRETSEYVPEGTRDDGSMLGVRTHLWCLTAMRIPRSR